MRKVEFFKAISQYARASAQDSTDLISILAAGDGKELAILRLEYRAETTKVMD